MYIPAYLLQRYTSVKRICFKKINDARRLRAVGSSESDIATLLSISRETVNKYTKDVVISKEQKYNMLSEKLQTYKYNYDVFENENAISYYLLGAFITDGCIIYNKNSCVYKASIVSKDKDWLKTIRDIICPEKILYKNKKSKAYTLVISNKRICEWFIKHGCGTRKSLTVKFPKVPKKYLRDFIRGCWDGDGCLCIYTSKERSSQRIYSYLASASRDFIRIFFETIQNKGINCSMHKMKLCNSKINDRQILAKNHLYKVHLSDFATIQLINFMYYENCLCMQRKFQKSKEILISRNCA